MNKRGTDNVLAWRIMYIVCFILITIGIIAFISLNRNDVGFWESYYAGQVVKAIDFAESGEVFEIDVSKAVKIAADSGITNFENGLFVFDNEKNRVIVKLHPKGGTELNYFKEVDVVEGRVEIIDGKIDLHKLHFEIKDSREIFG
jgi:hypothetical protein